MAYYIVLCIVHQFIQYIAQPLLYHINNYLYTMCFLLLIVVSCNSSLFANAIYRLSNKKTENKDGTNIVRVQSVCNTTDGDGRCSTKDSQRSSPAVVKVYVLYYNSGSSFILLDDSNLYPCTCRENRECASETGCMLCISRYT